MAKININLNDLPRVFDRAVQEALAKTGKKLDQQFDTEVTSVIWPWDRGDTFRKNKDIASSPRDIVDLGDLRDSKSEPEKIDNYSLKWTWKVDYSAIVHNGGKFKDGTEYPKRPWTETAEKEVNIENYFADILRREIDG